MCCCKIKLHLECISQHATASLLCSVSDAKEYQSWINSYHFQCCNKLQMDSINRSMLQSRTQRLKTKPHITRGHILSQIYVHLQCLGSIKNAHLALYERKQWITFYISPWRVMINALGLECVASPYANMKHNWANIWLDFTWNIIWLQSNGFLYSHRNCVKNNCSNLLNSYEIVTGKKKSLL